MSRTWKSSTGEKYSWFFLDISSGWVVSVLFTLAIIGLAIGLFILYGHISSDTAPDSFAPIAAA